MKELTFRYFAQSVRPLLSEGETDGEYVRRLLISATSYDDEDFNPIHDMKADTLKRYLAGTREITNLAKDLYGHIDKQKFAGALEKSGWDAQMAAYKDLSPLWPSMTDGNIPESCADILEDLFRRAMQRKRARKGAATIAPGSMNSPLEEDDNYLLDECNRSCTLCHKPLLRRRRGSVERSFEKVRVTPPATDYKERSELERAVGSLPIPATLADMALLCPDCAEDYKRDPTPEKFAALVRAKRKLQKSLEARTAIDELELEQEISMLISSLADIDDSDEDVALNFHAIEVKDKISSGNGLLRSRVMFNASRYYGFIRERFQELDHAGELDFEMIQSEVRLGYKKLNRIGLGQEEIFEQMTEWISEKSQTSNALASEIVVSFFVQNCEVFDATSE